MVWPLPNFPTFFAATLLCVLWTSSGEGAFQAAGAAYAVAQLHELTCCWNKSFVFMKLQDKTVVGISSVVCVSKV